MSKLKFDKLVQNIIAQDNIRTASMKSYKDIILEEDEAGQAVSQAIAKANPDAAKLPQDTGMWGKIFGGLKQMVHDISNVVPNIVKHVPVVGKGISKTLQTLNPMEPDFLRLDKIPGAYVDGAKDSWQTAKKWFDTDEGKKVAEQFKADNEQKKKALIAQAGQINAIKKAVDDKEALKKLNTELKKIRGDQKDGGQNSPRKLCHDIYKAVQDKQLKDGEYIIHLQD